MANVTVSQGITLLRNFAPEEYSYKKEYDNIGLMLGNESAVITKIMCCLDVTEKVIDEAIMLGAELIISHHPFIFYPINRITSADVLGRKILKAAENKISIYAAHTNLDYVSDGINDFVASALGLRNTTCLDAYIDSVQGMGRVGDLPNRINCTALKNNIEKVLKDSFVRIIGNPGATAKRVAVINGGGGGDTKYIDLAKQAGADCIVTADLKHHVAVYASELGITVIEPQHFTMEHCYISRLVQILKIEAKSSKFDIEVIQSQNEICPRF